MEKLSKTKLSEFAQLKMKKKRDEKGIFIAEGAKSVEDTLQHFEHVAIIASEKWAEEHKNLEKLFTAPEDWRKKMSSMTSVPEVIAIYRKPLSYCIPDKLERKLYLMLEDVQDPGNIGTIVRIADWFGIDTIFASKNCADIFGSKAIQASMGTVANVNVAYCDLLEIIARNPEFPVYGTLLNGSDVYDSELSDCGFIVMGNEGRGISLEMQAKVSHPILIPPYPADSKHTDSLNVAMATAITVAEFRRRQR